MLEILDILNSNTNGKLNTGEIDLEDNKLWEELTSKVIEFNGEGAKDKIHQNIQDLEVTDPDVALSQHCNWIWSKINSQQWWTRYDPERDCIFWYRPNVLEERWRVSEW